MAKPVYETIAFLSDFGLTDEWVAVCKSVIWDNVPEARIVDVCHLVPPFDIRAGALILRNAALNLGEAVYLAVVDPGVGGNRTPLALTTQDGSVLVGPDNGLLRPAAEVLGDIKTVVRLTNKNYWRRPVCPTFHARDLFAPVTALLSIGEKLESLGETMPADQLVSAPWGRATFIDNRFEAEIIAADNFGTVRFNLSAADIEQKQATGNTLITLSIDNKNTVSAPLKNTFTDSPPGKPLFLVDSAELLCLAVNLGRADELYKLKPGQKVTVSFDWE